MAKGKSSIEMMFDDPASMMADAMSRQAHIEMDMRALIYALFKHVPGMAITVTKEEYMETTKYHFHSHINWEDGEDHTLDMSVEPISVTVELLDRPAHEKTGLN